MASRCARLATSGTTPPNRACSPTLEATASASRVRPRTIPTPLSSHEVSMPSTSASSVTSLDLTATRRPPHHAPAAGWSGRARQPAAHHDCVCSPTVVTAPPPGDLETGPFIQTDRGGVVRPYLEEDFAATAPPRLVQERAQQPAPESGPLMVRADGDRLDVGLVARGEQTCVTDDLFIEVSDQVVPSLRNAGQLRPECLDGPPVVREELALELCDWRDIPPPHPAQDDGTDVSGAFPLLPRRAHRPVGPPTLSGGGGRRSPREVAVRSLRAPGSTASGRRR